MVTDSHEETRETLTDSGLVDYLRRCGSSTISELVEFAGVTQTAIRQRLNRLMEQGFLVREPEMGSGRGRPTHRYSLSRAGERLGGSNYEDLAGILWSELRSVKDPELRRGLLGRIVARMSETYREKISGDKLQRRMESLVGLMAERDVPFEVREDDQGHPVLTALSCPYPELAEQDRSICAMEKMLFSEILGDRLRLSGCRLDGAQCCTFEGGSAATVTM
ncbi:MAG: winged helix-turn-helix transcriptional regulator [Planctomycetes bacterium]|nr:winged helix-turn-helix transcriptional regulator [Planctomycetota bacterium]